MIALLFVLLAQRQTANFDRNWRFHLGDVPGAQQPQFADSTWRTLDLPHDWSIEGPFSEQNPAGVAGGAATSSAAAIASTAMRITGCIRRGPLNGHTCSASSTSSSASRLKSTASSWASCETGAQDGATKMSFGPHA